MTEKALKLGAKAQELRNKGKFSEAKKLVTQIITLVDKENYFILGQLYAFYAQLERDLKNLDSALTWYVKAMKTYKSGGFSPKEIHVLRHIAEIETQNGNTKKAQVNYIKVLNFYKSNEKTPLGELANTQRGYALLLEKIGDAEKAKKYWIKTRNLYKELDIIEGINECENHISKL